MFDDDELCHWFTRGFTATLENTRVDPCEAQSCKCHPTPKWLMNTYQAPAGDAGSNLVSRYSCRFKRRTVAWPRGGALACLLRRAILTAPQRSGQIPGCCSSSSG